MANFTEGLADDMSSYSYEYSLLGVFSHPLPVEMVISTLVWTVCFLATAGNILVFVGILGDRQLRSNVTNIYILNLASADLSVGLNSVTISNVWRYYGNWPFGKAICKLWLILDYAACMQAAFAVCLISMDRYFMVTKFHEYQKYSSRRLAVSLIAATWTVSLVTHALPLFGNDLWPKTKAYGEINFSVTCDFGSLYIVSYNISLIVIGFVVPVIVLTYLNFKVYSNILKRSKRLVRTEPVTASTQNPSSKEHATEPTVQSALPISTTTSQGPPAHDARKTYKRHRKSAITLAVIVGIFFLCWTPYYILQFLYIFDEVKFTWLLWNSVYYTIWTNSAINPFLYAATSPPIRRRFLQVLCFWNGRALRKIHSI